jgi:type I restriction enzyme, S subunit
MSATSQLFPKVPLGALFDLEYGAALPESIRTGSGFPVFGSSGTVGRHSTYFVEGPGIIVGRKGSVGQVSWSSESFWPIDTAYYVVSKEQQSLRWLYWLLSNTALKRLDAATGVPGLNRNDVYAIQTHRPEPAEQSRIAAVLDTVDEAIAKTEAVIAKLKQVRAGLLHDLLTRGIDKHGQLRNPSTHPEQFQDSSLGCIPGEWGIKTLNELVASAVDGPFGSHLKTEHYVNEPGVRVVRLH